MDLYVYGFFSLAAILLATWLVFLIKVLRRYSQAAAGHGGLLGFIYDPKQDVYYADINAWQKQFGYCRLYDEAMAPMSMNIDSEPIRFSYGGKQWLIEFWKGQYGLCMGAEVGVYNTLEPYKGEETLYQVPAKEEYLPLSFVLFEKGSPIMRRQSTHWWLTGFKLGAFAHPKELNMSIQVTCLDLHMRDTFVRALLQVGYHLEELCLCGNAVCVPFSKPKTRQPRTRTSFWECFNNIKNKCLCWAFRGLTKKLLTGEEKIAYLQRRSKRIPKGVRRQLSGHAGEGRR